MTNLPEAAREGAPEAARRLREAMRELDAALGHLDIAFAAALDVRNAGAVPSMIYQASRIIMAADTMLLRRLLRATQEHA